jgi:predicted Zn-dependent peptidase
MPVSQGKLVLGFNTGTVISPTDDRYYTALMFNEILGGSASSKLFLNVREKMSLCYFCSSSYSLYNGAVMVSSGIEVSKRELAKDAILAQLEDIRRGKISQFELEAAQKSIINSYLQLYDSPFDIYNFHSSRHFFGIKESIEDTCQKLLKVSKEQIQEFAKCVSFDVEYFIEGTNKEDGSEEDFENDE